MRRHFSAFCLLLTAAIFMASCLNSEDDTTYYDDAAITSFSLTSAKMTKHTTASTGDDSTYVEVSTDVSSYNFKIDQLKGLIYNVDSLPLGTDLTKVLCSYYTKNNSYAAIKSLTSDSLLYFSTSDSIDFSTPRTISVFSSSGLNKKDYTITVNMHKEAADSFKWKQFPDSKLLAGYASLKAYSLNGSVVVMASDGEKSNLFTMDTNSEKTFKATDVVMSAEAYKNAVVKNGTLYVLDGQTLRKSSNATDYETVAENAPLKRLVAASTTELYGTAADNTFMVSTDNGLTWKADKMESDISFVPTDDISYVCSTFSHSTNSDQVLLFGNRYDEANAKTSTAFVWRKIVEHDTDSNESLWAYYNYDSVSKNPLKSMKNLSVVKHGDYLLAIGGKGINGCSEKAYSTIYVSTDNGLSWTTIDTFGYPYGFDKSASAVSVCTDSDNFIWIVMNNSGQVWRGRLNEVAWGK